MGFDSPKPLLASPFGQPLPVLTLVRAGSFHFPAFSPTPTPPLLLLFQTPECGVLIFQPRSFVGNGGLFPSDDLGSQGEQGSPSFLLLAQPAQCLIPGKGERAAAGLEATVLG